MSMTAMTSSTWITLPVCGKLELMLRPKKPSSHNTTRTTTIVHNMRFLLLNDLWVATRSTDRVAVDLAVEQDEAGCSAQPCDWVTAAPIGPARSGLGALNGRFPSFDECGPMPLLLVENILSTLL